ncbi:MAG: type I polyketide synthase, partial [Anaerolineales bacterium]|nr:type I polyketide synthase [Anaerolineales bacterium]
MVHPDFQERNNDLDIAVIGMACRFPGAQNIGEFWKNLSNGVESIKFFTDQELIAEGVDPEVLRDPNYVKAASIIEGVDEFDASFFGYSAKEAKMMDPQHRLFLETSWEALGTAGYPPRGGKRSIGVFAGESMSTYRLYNLHGLLDDRDFILSQKNIGAVIGNNSDFLATRVSYKLNLRGPSVNVQTACSTSLVAVHTAYQSLLNGECDMALAGGVSIYLPQKAGYFYQEGMILSRDGHCRTFDADATGTIFGRGVGVVVLKRLADALADHDNIRAVIIGSAINNDGAQKVGFTAPSVDGQAEVIAEALAVAGIEAETINYIETHGTGTPKGDPIEIEALTQVYRLSTSRKGFCAIGSVKSNIGHLDAASAAASLIKTVLALEKRQVPPSLHFKKPNPEINFGESPFYVNTSLKEWGRNLNPRRAGVSSFGIGGTNVHLILEEAPPSQVAKKANERPHQVLALSAVNEAALGDLAARFASYLKDHRTEDIGDICYTTNSGRTHFDHRLAIRGNSTLQLHEKLSAYRNGQTLPGIKSGLRQYEPGQNIAFLFSGQGSQYVGMGQQLYETQPSFREIINQCDELMRQYLGVSLLSVLYPEDEASTQIHETIYTQPTIFAIEYALAQLWQSWGIEPSVVLGHSLGEYAAACVAGVFSLEDGFKLVAERGRLMLSLPDNGAMVVVFAPEDDVANAITKYSDTLSIAAINGSVNTVVSGTTGSMDLLIGEFETLGVRTQRLKISRPAHSPDVDPMLDAFEDAAQRITYQEPQIDMVSGFMGKIVKASQINNARYWRRNIREAVLFSDAMNTLIENSCKIFIETGPAPTLLSMGRKCVPKDAGLWLPSLRPKREDWQQMLDSLGELYAYGIEVDWGGFDKDYERHRVVLPTYPFQRKSYWIHADRKKAVNTGGISEGYEEPSVHPLLNRRLISPSLKDIVFESKISSNAPAFIKDHQIQGSVVFPAAAIIEMILSAGNLTNGDWVQSIEDL